MKKTKKNMDCSMDNNSSLKQLIDDGNCLVDEREEEIILHKKGAGLKKIYLEPTSACNLQCITCVRQHWPRFTEGEMDMELFDKLLGRLKAFPDLERIHLGGFGEPLAHSQALQVIRKLTDSGYMVSLNTNGTLVTPDAARTLIESGVHIVYFSIDGVDESTFRKIRVGGELNDVAANIMNLQKLKQEMNAYNPKVVLEFVLMRSNLDQLPLMPKLAKEVGAPTVLVTNLLAHSEEMFQEVLYDIPGDKREMGAGVMAAPGWDRAAAQHSLPNPVVWPAVEQDYVMWGSVRMPRMYWGSSRRCAFVNDNAAVIRWDGSVSPCYGLMYSYPYLLDNRSKAVSAYLLGNIGSETLYDIWNKPEYVRFRYRVRNYNFPSCMDCSNSGTCDFAEDNEDCWGNAPSCADCLWSQGIVRCP